MPLDRKKRRAVDTLRRRAPDGWRRRGTAALLLAGAAALYAAVQLGQLAHPLLWQDEGETAMYARRVLAYGYPRVHGERNVVYEFGANIAQGVKEGPDAYIGTTWGHFYFAAPAVWWAAGYGDPYARTWRLRLPFALAGAGGLVAMLLAVLPAYRGRPQRALLFSACFFLLAATSVSLQLHLREVRYYALLTLLLGGVLWLHLGYAVHGTVSFRRWSLGLTILLVLVFNVFYSAWFALMALLGLERLVAIRRGHLDARAGLRELLPFALSALCVAPLLVFFETFTIAADFSRDLGLTARGYLHNLGRVALHFLRHELLAPVLISRALVWVRGGTADAGRRTADLLSLFALGYALLACVNPLVYERYFVVLSPVLSLVFLLDALHLTERSPRWAIPLALLVLVSWAVRWPELHGRAEELTTPYRGPLDFAVPYLLERYPRPQELIVATNYENHPLMYYLGSRVIVGTNLSNIVVDRTLAPDVVIPRRRWSRGMDELRRFLARGTFERRRFPVEDLRWNNVPALSRSPFVPEPHRFRTAVPVEEEQAFEIWERVTPGS
jgi:hypothetical protein